MKSMFPQRCKFLLSEDAWEYCSDVCGIISRASGTLEGAPHRSWQSDERARGRGVVCGFAVWPCAAWRRKRRDTSRGPLQAARRREGGVGMRNSTSRVVGNLQASTQPPLRGGAPDGRWGPPLLLLNGTDLRRVGGLLRPTLRQGPRPPKWLGIIGIHDFTRRPCGLTRE